MGKGIDLARGADLESGGSGLHADVLDDFKDQLLLTLLLRCADSDNHVVIPVTEVDATGAYTASFSVNERVFNFFVSKKS